MDADLPRMESDLALLTQAVCLLTEHLTRFVPIVEQSGSLMKRTTDQLHALQSVVLGFVNLVETLQRRVDVLERRLVGGAYRAH